MGEQHGQRSRLPYGLPACALARDDVDRLLLDWERERPDLDFTPVGIITRLARVRTRMDAELSSLFARYGLTGADFTVIVTLRRSGAPYTLPQARLMDALGLTSGTVSVRLDRLEKAGIVTRSADPASARSSLVSLTPTGLRLFDQIAPEHLRNEDRLLSALDADERQILADLLRRLLADFETSPPQPLAELGLLLEPAHVARQRRQAVGLPDEPGLLVAEVQPASTAQRLGLERGDLLVRAGGSTLSSTVQLATVLHEMAGHQETVAVTLLRGQDTIRKRLPIPTPLASPHSRS